MRLTKTMKAFIALFLLPLGLLAQVTNGSITGTIKDASGNALQGATVEAVHEPSGTKYSTASNKTGKFNIPGLRVGGPYKVTVTYVGFKTETTTDVWIQLGEPSVIEFSMADAKTDLKEITLTTSRKGALISKDRKGTSTNINSRLISSLPTLNRSITDITKLTPQSNGTSFAGQDNRAINFTLDGSIFNNSFGLTALNGGQANATPISLDAIQEIQINVSPYNLKDGGFTGASINAVTKSGTNTEHGTMFYNFRNQGLVGTKAGASGKQDVITNTFDVKQFGISLGGAIIKNKLFYFVNYEGERRTDPGTTTVAKNAGNTFGGNVTSVLESDLLGLQSFLASKFNYQTGSYQGYSVNTNSDKAVARLDWNISDKHKLSIRGNLLNSHQDKPISPSGSVGGSRLSNTSMSFSNSAYQQYNNIYGVIAQLNSRISNNVSNELTFGYTANRDYRNLKGAEFPTVDIQNGLNTNSNYISFGPDPFTPNNNLNTDTWQFSDNLTVYKGKHTVSLGLSYESFTYENGFTPRILGVYTFKSLNDFYTAANNYLNNTNTPVPLQAYSASWSNLPNGEVFYATTKARTIGAYIQDDYELEKNFNITYGVRFDIPFFANEGVKNSEVDNMNFVNEKGEATKLSTSKLPGYKVMVNPRIGFNYDVNGDKSVQIRGGAGLFTGRPPFVYISNQIGNNGVTSGGIDYSSTNFGNGLTTGPNNTQIVFTPKTPAKPITGFGYKAPPYSIATTEENFRFPQIFRSNLAVDYKISKDVIASAEGIFTQSLSNIFYYNANLTPSSSNFIGPDNRPRFAGVASGTLGANNTFGTTLTNTTAGNNKINSQLSDATVMKSGPLGGSFMTTLKLEKPLKAQGFGWMVAYNFGYSRDFINPGSIAFSSWRDNKSVNGNNRPDIAFSDYDTRNRLIANLNYRKELSKSVAIQFSLFYEGRNQGRFSYVYSGDMNGDGVPSNNDLLFIPTVAQLSQMKFENYPINGVVQTQAMQQAAFENYIQQDKYLSGKRGEYAERNGVLMPTINKFDVSAMVELFRNMGKQRHSIQLRADIFNVGNLINPNSGVSYIQNTLTPVSFRGVDNTTGLPVFRMTSVNNSINYSTYRKGTGIGDVWQMQLGIRYIF